MGCLQARCIAVRKILRNLSVRVQERDLLMCRDHVLDLRERSGGVPTALPQVFIHGRLLGVSCSLKPTVRMPMFLFYWFTGSGHYRATE